MARISDAQISFLRLIDRSPDLGEGWREVSGALRDLVERRALEASELVEIRREGDRLRIRPSEEARVVLKWL